MKRLHVATLIVLAVTIRVSAGGVEYPALGNIDGREGTLEIWFTPMIDVGPGDESVSYEHRFRLFQWEVPGQYTVSGGCWRRGGRTLAGASMGSPLFDSALINTYGSAPKSWQQGQVCHLAFVWDGHDMRFFCGDQPMGYRKQAISLDAPLSGRTITIGNEGGRDSRVVIHAVRFSSIARTPQMLAASEPKADIYTLLFDRFTSADDREAEVISGFSGETGGVFRGACRFVAEPRPGIAMFHEK